MATYVLVHGACHEGHHFEDCAAHLRAAGHTVFLPTLKGNRPGDSRKTTTLEDAINSLVEYFDENKIDDAILLGHSWGGIPITGAADRLAPGRVRRLIYYCAFVPNNGESLMDLCPPHYQVLFPALAGDTGEVLFPFPILREAFINDASAEQAQALFDTLNPQPFNTMNDRITLSKNPAEMQIGKSFLHCTEDTSLPQSLPFHPRLSEKLGLYRLVSMPGSHSTFVTAPALLAQKIIEAGRD
ncbi:alpha/beta fold hydrolase [Rhizobium sp. C1]|uniref:alpha/beta fold hydrolase n=1 Tax=Rhizobium sp. C1 TaxID=1349799 RepID=UPI001E5AACC8|nr:alpha/beta hydrolase [Rhizobium sp. C1]MCD2178586.1 alpha/beta hydrolase [Rhizobium sp. C1]